MLINVNNILGVVARDRPNNLVSIDDVIKYQQPAGERMELDARPPRP